MTMFYGSRFAPKPTGAHAAPARPAGRTLAEALADPIAVLRIRVQYDQANRPRWVVDAWTAHFEPVALDTAAQQRLLEQWRQRFPALNYWRSHQIDVRGPRVVVGASPEPHEDGYIPSDQRTFGGYRQPVLADRWTPPLPWAAPEPITTRRAA